MCSLRKVRDFFFAVVQENSVIVWRNSGVWLKPQGARRRRESSIAREGVYKRAGILANEV
jgi:hypothetical protein